MSRLQNKPATNKLTVENLSVFKQEKNTRHVLLDGVSFQLNRHQMVALCGPNGSGKTTLLKVLAHLEKPSSGSVAASSPMVGKSAFAYVPTNFICQQAFRVATVIDIHLYEYQKQAIQTDEKLCRQWRERLRIDELLSKNILKISSGENKRLSVYLGLLRNPQILLLDEPDANCDPDVVEDIFQLLGKIDDCLIIAATHNLNIALSYAHEFIILNRLHQIEYFGDSHQKAGSSLKKLYGNKLTSVRHNHKSFLLPQSKTK